MAFHHISVMPEEVIDGLAIRPDGIYVDCTLGGAGHAHRIAERLSTAGRLIGIDQDEAAIEAIGRMSPPRVVYVSCDPATLGRDVKRLAAHGYTAVRARAFDLFPRTHHVETVVLLARDGAEEKN